LAIDRKIRAGDVIVCRVNGTSDFYVVGAVVSGEVGGLSLRAVVTIVGRDSALRHAYRERMQNYRVWLFDGAAAAYVETAEPLETLPTIALPSSSSEQLSMA
jgi:hypothetical protein